ncbi:carbohydrate ABC transporter permease [Campylobacter jejuni]|uniref:Carbohydrate ABC transporter permease n=1 Tax=Campylobacter jejuni TaxID=197 RepID=A0A5T1IWF6_CAMJU|nr:MULTISPECIES: carbohydrate ABC transporter permease [Campylobacter]EAH4502752.1 carbohydrate ABC transporter permease [Campylobacter jejuni]EAH4596286.1 carbohydrate ABC transporter permease [Campylobacter jejuni]EAH5417620.1 carbohydrate ABC transporter permease [Campylobacter jejuni]EAH7216250.1 carbohydrate ABC transporter permease [Campylobacter jejuni]EAH7999338.1 carbohydrate ABC transporter permease [Campylobacter jejuni]
MFRILRHLILGILSLFFIFPFVWMVITSFKPENEIFSNAFHFFPQNFTLIENYTKAFKENDLLHFLFNGFFVCFAILLIQIIIAYPCAYALSKYKFKGQKFLLVIIVCSLLIPTQAICVPWYILMYYFGVLDSYLALILPFSISVFGIFLIRQFINCIPNDIIYAARMDGLNEFSILCKIILPLTTPALISFGIFSIVAHWNDYFWPLIAVSSPQYFTPTLGVISFKNNEAGTDYGTLMAASTIVVAPLIIGFLLAQKRFIQGVANTGIK